MKEIGHRCTAGSTSKGEVHLKDKVLLLALSHSLVSLPLEKKRYIYDQKFHPPVLQVGRTVMHACTWPHKHSNVCKAQLSAKVHNPIYAVEPLLDQRKGWGGYSNGLQRWPKETWTQFKPFQMVLILNRTSNILSPILLRKTLTSSADEKLLRNDKNKESYLTN